MYFCAGVVPIFDIYLRLFVHAWLIFPKLINWWIAGIGVYRIFYVNQCKKREGQNNAALFCPLGVLPHLGTVQSGWFVAFRIWERYNPVVLLPSAFGKGAIWLICCIRGARRIKNTRIVDFHDSVLFLLFVFEWVSFVTSGCCCRVVVVLFVNYGLKIRIILEICLQNEH